MLWPKEMAGILANRVFDGRNMPVRTPPQNSRARHRWVTVGLVLLAGGLSFWLLTRETGSNSLERRINKLLKEQRREEFEDSLPDWVQGVFSRVRGLFRSQNSDRGRERLELNALGPRAIPDSPRLCSRIRVRQCAHWPQPYWASWPKGNCCPC